MINLIFLSLLDSLNPFSIAAMIFVTAGDKYLHRGISFIAGTFLTYFFGGICFVFGFSRFLKSFFSELPTSILSMSLIILGVGLILYSIYSWFKKSEKVNFANKVINSIFGIFIFAVIATFMDLPSAIPYFEAIRRINEQTEDALNKVFMLLIYNAGYVFPLCIILFVRSIMTDNKSKIFQVVQVGIDWSHRRLLPPLIFMGGFYCLYLANLYQI